MAMTQTSVPVGGSDSSATHAATFNLETLNEPITRILSAPGVDLETISAKRVRKQLLEDASLGLTAEGLKLRRDEVDRLIAQIYEVVSQRATNKRKREDGGKVNGANDEAGDSETGGDAEEEPKSPQKKRGKKTVEESDAELARKLSSEINGRSRRSTASPKKTKRRAMKSSATVDSEDDGDDGDGKKKKRSGGARGGFAKEFTLSAPLSAVVGVEKLSRPQVVKKLWEYIHGHGLQNPSNKKEIICDDALRAIFAVEKIDMFRMNKVLGQHLHEG
ncbi:hypothetical protein V8B97DRAFT_450835 [Scleroderma yunnanense]